MFAPENQCLENEIPGFPCGARTLAKRWINFHGFVTFFCPVPCPKSTKMWWSWKTPTPPPPRKLTWLAGKSTIRRCMSYWKWWFSNVMFVFRGVILIWIWRNHPINYFLATYATCIVALPHFPTSWWQDAFQCCFFCKSHVKGTKNTFASAKQSSEVMSWYKN